MKRLYLFLSLLACLWTGARAQSSGLELITGTRLETYHVSWSSVTLAIQFTASDGGLQGTDSERENMLANLQYFLEQSTGYEEGMEAWEVIIDDEYSGTILLDLPPSTVDREILLELPNVTITILQSGEGNFYPFDLSCSGTLENGGSVSLTLSGTEIGATYEILKNGEVLRSYPGSGEAITAIGFTEAGRYFARASNGDHSVNIATCLVPAPSTGGGSEGDGESTGGEAADTLTGAVPTNYTVVTTYLDATTSTATPCVVTDASYLDGLGRVVQEVAVGASPSGADIVTPARHGAFGREEKSYLPFVKANNGGAFVPNAFSASNWIASHGETEAAYTCSETFYDDSPLNRKLRQVGAGKNWKTNDKGVTHGYRVNAANEVRRWRVSADGTPASPGFYPAGTLSKTTITDEDGHLTEEFTDGNGRVVLGVSYDGDTPHRTYSVHDDLGRLRLVIPPAVGDKASLTAADLDDYCYRYTCDKRGLQIEKKLPGAAPVYLLHDRRERLVLSQDGRQRASNKWLYNLYDDAGRVIESGECTITADLAALRETVANSENYIPENRTPLLYNYYDNYFFEGVQAFDGTRNISGYADTDVSLNGHEDLVPGMQTGSKVRVLDDGGETWITTTTYYDYKHRPVQVITSLYPSGTGVVSTRYDFTGNVLQTKEWQTIGSTTTIVEQNFTYDNRGRLLTSKLKVNEGTEITTSELTHDELGRLKTRKLHGGIETLTYSCNVRDWLTRVEGSKFSEELGYETPLADLPGNVCYNGNISAMTWKNGANERQAFSYSYDGLNRLTGAVYNNGWTGNGNYSVPGITYDKNGNILTLQRKNNGTLVDNLSYRYSGNRLQNVTDASGNAFGYPASSSNPADQRYAYDENGNMTKDLNKNVSNITYNYLNLPREVTRDGQVIKYVYTATGEKLGVAYSTSNAITYNGGMIRDGNSSLKYILTGEGRYVMNGTTGTMEYNITDRLGNVRVVLNDSGEVIQSNDYYPFGMLMAQGGSSTNKYLYNGKEVQEQTGWLDYGARMYDASLGRWFNIDPMAEKYLPISPYAYCANNVVNAIDAEGKLIIFINGNHYGDGGKADYWGKWYISMTRSGPGIDGTKVFFNRHEFNVDVMNHLNDYNVFYRDGALGGWAPFNINKSISFNKRVNAGYTQAMKDASSIVESLARDKDGNITETIKIITHSMGGAYGQGYAQAILEYLDRHNIDARIDFIAHFAPFQSDRMLELKHKKLGEVLQFSHEHDGIAGCNPISGATFMKTKNTQDYRHSIFDFIHYITSLPQGTYRVINGNLVPQNN